MLLRTQMIDILHFDITDAGSQFRRIAIERTLK
jgi:hypothetical protein